MADTDIQSRGGSSLAKRFVAIVVLAIASWIILKVVIGILAGLATFIAVIAAIFAVIWAIRTL